MCAGRATLSQAWEGVTAGRSGADAADLTFAAVVPRAGPSGEEALYDRRWCDSS
jgi:hypothetical protein